MKTYEINVTQEHIKRARRYSKDRRDEFNCPIALAVREQTPFKHAGVDQTRGVFLQTTEYDPLYWPRPICKSLCGPLPSPLLAFILHFDGRGDKCPCPWKDRDVVKPLNFTLELSE